MNVVHLRISRQNFNESFKIKILKSVRKTLSGYLSLTSSQSPTSQRVDFAVAQPGQSRSFLAALLKLLIRFKQRAPDFSPVLGPTIYIASLESGI